MGNALVCISVYSNYTMRTVTNIFIVNLAVADFFVILFCLPPTVVWDVTETWFLGESMCKVVLYFQVSFIVNHFINVYSIHLKLTHIRDGGEKRKRNTVNMLAETCKRLWGQKTIVHFYITEVRKSIISYNFSLIFFCMNPIQD